MVNDNDSTREIAAKGITGLRAEEHLKKTKAMAEVLGSEDRREEFFQDIDAVLEKYNLSARPGLALDAVRYVIEEEYLRQFRCYETL